MEYEVEKILEKKIVRDKEQVFSLIKFIFHREFSQINVMFLVSFEVGRREKADMGT